MASGRGYSSHYRRFALMALAWLSAWCTIPAQVEPTSMHPDSSLVMATNVEVDSDFSEPPKRIPAISGPVFREVRSVPYPSGAIYLDRGICGAFMGGKHQNLNDSKSLYLWQGEVSYYYQPYLSGGVAFRIKAGEPSDKKQTIQNRFFLTARFHKSWNGVAIFVGPQLGLDNINVLDGTPKLIDTVSILAKPINNTNASIALDAGGGWKFSRWVGATLGANMEYSLATDDSASKNISFNLHVHPGLAVDILAFSDGLRELVPAMYLSLEFQLGFLVLERKGRRSDQAAILGLGLAF